MLLRSVGRNEGGRPIVMTFVGRQRERLLHAGIVASVEGDFRNGVAVVRQGTDDFDALAMAFPPVPAGLAVALPVGESDEDAGAALWRDRVADRLTPEQRRLNMSRVRSKDTAPELLIRQLLHARGYRYRLHHRDLRGRPDVVLPKHQAAVFVNGCFWHGHGCSLFRMPATRPDFWATKIAANCARDAAARVSLRDLG